MPDAKPTTSKRVKVFWWIATPVLVVLWGLLAIALLFDLEDETEDSTAQANITPTSSILIGHTPIPTRPPRRPTATPHVVHTADPGYQLWKNKQVVATREARERKSVARTTENYTAPKHAARVRHTVRSNDNIVSRKRISLDAGRYTLTKSEGCVRAELARMPSDALVASLIGASSKSMNVSSGSYMLRAIGNNCTATLSN
ncbi:MAG: hypothetical protein F4Y63_09910 [Chloroflexi bacterium]|nr:hypothetical protein [Chloroflexota bacterium]MYF79572.1 hypothetical protein [Chloroflexota bacterium]